jgi:membrane protease YdiL (CAAX protease family)
MPQAQPPARNRWKVLVSLLGALGFVLIVFLWFPLHDYVSRKDMEVTLAAGERREVDLAVGFPARVTVNGSIEPAWSVASGKHVDLSALDDEGKEIDAGGGEGPYRLEGRIERVAIRAGDVPARVTLRVLDAEAEAHARRDEAILQALSSLLLIPFLAVVAVALRPWMARDRSTPCIRRRTGWIGIVIVGAPVAHAAIQGIASQVDSSDEIARALTSLFLLAWVVWLWVPAVVVIALASLERRAIGGRLLEIRASLGAAFLAMLTLGAMWYTWRLIAWLIPSYGGGPWPIDSTGAFPAAVLLAVSAGVTEELVFRGFLLTRLRELTGSTVGALLATSVAFGLIHVYQSVPHVLTSALFGLIMGVVTLGSRNLFAAILAHAAWDLLLAVNSAYGVVMGFV